jgi:hypothetical protein
MGKPTGVTAAHKDIITTVNLMVKPLLNRLNVDSLSILGRLAPVAFPISCRHSFENIATFCMFIGHGRSGSSLIGSLLNAHPNIVMSNELDILKYIDGGLRQNQLFCQIYFSSKRLVKRGSVGGGNYSYAVSGQWQGRHKELLVIGDRKAGATSTRILKKPELLNKLKRSITKDKKFIHVIRSPFDTISTTFKKTHRRPHEELEVQ